MFLALLDDRLALRKLETAAIALSEKVTVSDSPDGWVAEDSPTAVIIAVEEDGWQDTVLQCKQRWPSAMVVGLVTVPDPTLWHEAEDSGCDVVTTRGALHKILPTRLETWRAAPGGRRVRLFSLSDIAGRLGVVMRLDDPELGPVAVYHIGKDVVAVADLCPHAGAMLSNGEVSVDDGLVTCPEHGSRFNTSTGERVRGPADDGIRTFDIELEDGQAYLRIPAGWSSSRRRKP